MGVRMIVAGLPATGSDRVALYDSATGWAFGPVFGDEDEAQAFLDFLVRDARSFSNAELEAQHKRFVDLRGEDA